MLEEIIAPISAFLYPAYYVGDNMNNAYCLLCAYRVLASCWLPYLYPFI